MSEPLIGDRVVVRYRLGADTPADWRGAPNPATTSGPSLSDVTGVVVGDGADRIRLDRDDTVVEIPRSAVTSIRVLSLRTVRNSEIRAVEYAAAHAWPGTESQWIDGWLVRAGGGYTRRANCAVPIDIGARADGPTLSAITDWYRDRSLPPQLAWPDRLLPAAHLPGRIEQPVQVLTAEIAQVTGGTSTAEVICEPAAGSEWLDVRLDPATSPADHAMAAAVISSVRNGRLVFAGIRDDERLVAIGRGAITPTAAGNPVLGVTALHTLSGHRGRGLGGQVLAALLGWGRDLGAGTAYLQVDAANRAAGAWYRRLGFGLHHQYGYVRL
ncbi:MAG: GNAT family N-acetyltransferase [Gordonia sp.]|jgi:GNAT superfamily N-acetyltransferase|uniref:N-acetylglutamate synthase, CG3035 family n=1 Tax=Gordonia sp. (in: high G+C Gram-positive bacteria) TaxID=84139 RepID=UPI001D338A6C|nr:GNAT family N-acetyltransferase [Gordonia sp. (in: high G+C Gram-positive bacteria)]MCB1295630.1 GNAT family N-acetyltransferase [Gordonia sp. (in: high G+C Gram-positive bacteria)]HMS74827.1 GNAT family N-acetyltransferase [Gordonia sp. (in: high G+C Gram-positive bacteria)]